MHLYSRALKGFKACCRMALPDNEFIAADPPFEQSFVETLVY